MTTLRITRPGVAPDSFTVEPGTITEILRVFIERNPKYKGRENDLVRLNGRRIRQDERSSTTAGDHDVVLVSHGVVIHLSPETYSMI